jgi:hypothetical protein
MKPTLFTQKSFLLIILVALCSVITGCLGFRQDITDNPKYKTDYTKGQIYRTKQPLFLISFDLSKPDTLWLHRIGGSSYVPSTTEAYSTNKAQWPNVFGIIEPGTKISIVKLQRELNFENGWEFYVQAKVLDGIFAGKAVEVSGVSNILDEGKYYFLPLVNTEFLELQK